MSWRMLDTLRKVADLPLEALLVDLYLAKSGDHPDGPDSSAYGPGEQPGTLVDCELVRRLASTSSLVALGRRLRNR